MDLRGRIKQKLRETLLQEDEPDQNLVDSLLDKISRKGKESLTPLEKEYLDQASQGDVEPEMEERIEKAKAMGEYIIDLIDADNTGELMKIDHAHLMNAPQTSIDAYIEYMGKQGSIGINKLKLGSKEAINKYIQQRIEQGYPVNADVMAIADQEMVDKIIDAKMNDQVSQALRVDMLKYASPEKVDEYIKFMGQEGERLGSDILKMGSQKAIDSYIKQMADQEARLFDDQHELASERVRDYYQQKTKIRT